MLYTHFYQTVSKLDTSIIVNLNLILANFLRAFNTCVKYFETPTINAEILDKHKTTGQQKDP